MSLTPSQKQAIEARGNVLVAAGAGTGKTRTLVERCLACLLNEQPPASIDEVLIVTFTEAAAAEMRQRIHDRLQEESECHPADPRWQEQLALFETAYIGTLHSFCYQLVRQHFYQLALDPQLVILSEEEARLLADETLEMLFQRHYAGRDPDSLAVQELIQVQARGWDKPVRSLVLQLYHYAQSLPDPAAWLASQEALFASPEPFAWREWLKDALNEFRDKWRLILGLLPDSNQLAVQCAARLRDLPSTPSSDEFAAVFTGIASTREQCPRGKTDLWAAPLKEFFLDAEFLHSLLSVDGRPDPLQEDWAWIRGPMTALLGLAREFSNSFAETKRELGVLDFHDLEQHALRLLWDPTGNRPTTIAQHWREKLRFVLVDEYQDINAAQDKIIQALSRENAQANRFLVGDLKQSIYRFRLANPSIFQAYAELWSQRPGGVISLVENFRSQEGVLDFINSVFRLLLSRELGGVDYASGAALRFGAPAERALLSRGANSKPVVELHLLQKSSADAAPDLENSSGTLAEVMELQESEKEARLVGLRLQELHSQQHPVWDIESHRFRPVDWKDIAILLRSPFRKAESYAKEFARLGLPLEVARKGFYRSLEVSDLLSLLQVLDNPLQDLPILAVVHSPLVGLSANELAEIHLSAPKGRFWTALNLWYRKRPSLKILESSSSPLPEQTTLNFDPVPETARKVGRFLDCFARWRRLAHQVSLSRCLETILTETHYASWLLTQSGGAQRYANIQRLIRLAQDFDQFQRQGLFRFLRFIEAQQAAETEPEVAVAISENAVRLMSIHQSKGLEFPVVVVADLGKRFNLDDLRAELILDERYGVCPQVKPPHTGKRYPSLPYWLGSRRQLRELLSEELRLLYVAMTRARDTLILSGLISEPQWINRWQGQSQNFGPDTLLAARSYNDWLALWFSSNFSPDEKKQAAGANALLRWFVHDQAELAVPDSPAHQVESESVPISFDSETWRQVEKRLAWKYPFSAATNLPAKTSVSALRRQAAAEDEEAALLFPRPVRGFPSPAGTGLPRALDSEIRLGIKLSAADIGSAHHQFLQFVSLEYAVNADTLRREAHRLLECSRLTKEQAAVLDFDGLAYFWNSELGRKIRDRSSQVHRELAFTARFATSELAPVFDKIQEAGSEGEFVLVQGVADLAVIAPDEIWLVDFKTDQFHQSELAMRIEKYQPQLLLYASALSRIYGRPVSKSYLYFLGLRQLVPVKSREGLTSQ